MLTRNHGIKPITLYNIIDLNKPLNILGYLLVNLLQRLSLEIVLTFQSIVLEMLLVLDGEDNCRVLLDDSEGKQAVVNL